MAKKDEGWRSLLKQLSAHIESLHYIATHDEKTGLFNSLFFRDFFDEELKRVKRGGHFSIMIVDVDFFKRINDTYGHIVGDKILKRIGKVMQNSLRDYDIMARFGGEEFIALLPSTGIREANRIAERARIAILRDSFLSKYKVSISIGVAEYKERDNYHRLSHRADKALYKAKKTGRNKVVAIT